MATPSNELSAFLASPESRTCKCCRHEQSEAIDNDIRAYFEMREAGETRVSWRRFQHFIDQTYGCTVHRNTMLKHVSLCLGIDHGLSQGEL